MGCSESKDVQRISVSAANKKLEESVKNLDVVRISSASSDGSITEVPDTGPQSIKLTDPTGDLIETKNNVIPEERDQFTQDIPTTFDSIPVNDLGESLDARRMKGLWSQSGINSSHSQQSIEKPGSSSAMSNNSSDSGICDLEEDYSFVITETSPAELVRKVENEFTPLENIDLTITGKACPRLLSGSQRARVEEQNILQGLRDEGFIATTRQRAGGGVSFEIIEATPEVESAGSSKFKPQDFLPNNYKKHLDEQRNKYNTIKSSEDVQKKIEAAQERRQQVIEQKKGISSALAKPVENVKAKEIQEKQSQKADAAMQKREEHLKELRDKLKAQNKRAQTIKLKKILSNHPPVPVPIPVGGRPRADASDDFFD